MQRTSEIKQISEPKSNDYLKESADWHLLICSLLNKDPTNSQFTIALNQNKEAVINTKDEKLVSQLNKILRSPEAIRSNIKYTLEIKGNANHQSHALIEPDYSALKIPELKHGMGEKIFESLFDKSTLKRIGSPVWANELENEHYVLTATCEDELENFTQDQFKKYVNILSSATFKELREAISNIKSLKLGMTQKGALVQNADKIFYVIKDQQGKALACFDFGLLLRCLSAPKFDFCQKSDGNEFQIKFKTSDFMSYLSTVLNEGFLLHIPENKDGKQEARPICFNAERAIPLEIVISFILDCSGSMASVFEAYIHQVIQFIEQLSKTVEYASARIRIQPFATALFTSIDKPLAEAELLINYLKELKANGNTRLNDAVLSEFKHLQTKAQQITGSVAIFTDGEDNQSPANVTQDLEDITSEFKTNGNPIKAFTFGIGKDYNAEKSKNLSTATGGHHHKLENIDEFKSYLSSHLDDYCRARRLVRFIEEESERVVTVAVKEGEIAVSNQTLTIPNNFSVNGGPTYQVKLGAAQLENKTTKLESRNKLGFFEEVIPTHQKENEATKPEGASCLIM